MPNISLYETANGRWWLPKDINTDVVIAAMRRGDVFEPEIVAAAARHIRPGIVVLDVGSNFGQMTVLFARMVGKDGVVHAFEADPFVCDLLRRNLAENGCANAVVHEGAVWHADGQTLSFPEPDFLRFGSYGSYGIDPKATGGRSVRSLTIDSLGIDRPISFMKIDVQGSDLFAMRGVRRTLMRHRMPFIYEFEEQLQQEFGTSFVDYQAFVADIGYEVVSVVNGINYLVAPRPGLLRRALRRFRR